MSKLKKWFELPVGTAIVEPGSSIEYETGSWRTFKPVLDKEKCNHCLICWVFCPDNAVVVKDGKMEGFDYEHCKGCGICAEVCPDRAKAITMVLENQ